MQQQSLGSLGEGRAARYLRLHGYRILARNFVCRGGEIDLIARRGRIVAFVEVKLRKNADYGAAGEFVDYRKQQRLLLAAEVWISQNPRYEDDTLRFDVIELYAPEGEHGSVSLRHIENAFDAGDM